MEKLTAPYALVVDDDPVILIDASEILKDTGSRVYEADDSDQAKLLLKDMGRHVALLFSDLEMPRQTNGFALAHHVEEHWPEIEIVIANGRIKPAAGDMPKTGTFISKPFNAAMTHVHLREKLPDAMKPEPFKIAV